MLVDTQPNIFHTRGHKNQKSRLIIIICIIITIMHNFHTYETNIDCLLHPMFIAQIDEYVSIFCHL